ncbi:15444_t:CDS:2 [Funneliformis geosporum]|uniref:16243_t:CDS:1 n=1 Tax=Funneliformis geosporum TaxID=1117311 RepID=A0A9W4ST06_9GLOM|nr:16243_t:CDS:2 [Funneliformis geosporum]CAI2188754.1 15444_t:CDS:2 [Funneliformis geosporum]
MNDRDLVNLIVDDLQPFITVVNENFCKFISHLNKRYILPLISKFKGLIFNNIQELQQLLTQLLHDIMILVNFITDEWIAYHHLYIEIPYPHTSLNIAKKLAKTFDHWEFKECIFADISDIAPNVVKAISDLIELDYEVEHIRYAAYTIQYQLKKV